MSRSMPYVYSTDERFVKITAVSIVSLLAHNPGARIIVLLNGVGEGSIAFLRVVCEKAGGIFEGVDVRERLIDLERRGANGYVSYSTYARLFIPQLIDDSRALYIDGDTLVAGNLSALATFDMGGMPCALAYDCQRVEYRKMIGIPVDAPYYNAGVMLIDCVEWRRRECTARLISEIPNRPKYAFFADQDLISRAMNDEIALLPPAYNFLPHYQMFRTRDDVLKVTGVPEKIWYSREAYAAARKKPMIHHFLGNTLGRPWYRESKNPLRAVYRKYAEGIGAPEVVEQTRALDFGYRVQAWCWRWLPNWLFVQACRAMYRYFFWSRYGV